MVNEDYLAHKVDKLWREVEDLKKKVEALEKRLASASLSAVQGLQTNVSSAQQPSGTVQVQQPTVQVSSVPAKKAVDSPHIDPVLKVLRERGPMNILQLNSALREMGIAETVRDTLFKRVKKLMEEGKVGFDDNSQTFYAR